MWVLISAGVDLEYLMSASFLYCTVIFYVNICNVIILKEIL